jgi:hypothetical protein
VVLLLLRTPGAEDHRHDLLACVIGATREGVLQLARVDSQHPTTISSVFGLATTAFPSSLSFRGLPRLSVGPTLQKLDIAEGEDGNKVRPDGVGIFRLETEGSKCFFGLLVRDGVVRQKRPRMPFEPPGRRNVPLAASMEYSDASSIPKDLHSSIPAPARRRGGFALHGASKRGCAICREGNGGLWHLQDDLLTGESGA